MFLHTSNTWNHLCKKSNSNTQNNFVRYKIWAASRTRSLSLRRFVAMPEWCSRSFLPRRPQDKTAFPKFCVSTLYTKKTHQTNTLNPTYIARNTNPKLRKTNFSLFLISTFFFQKQPTKAYTILLSSFFCQKRFSWLYSHNVNRFWLNHTLSQLIHWNGQVKAVFSWSSGATTIWLYPEYPFKKQ